MILAEDEVDLGSDHDGIMVLDDALEPGTPLAYVLPLVEEVLDVEATGNRPDLLSLYGIAREVAALFDGELVPLDESEPARGGDEPVDDPDRGSRRLPALRRPAVPRRRDRRVARLAEGAAPRGRRPLDLERRRRDELRHARARQPAARVRLRDARTAARSIVRRATKGEKLRTLDGTDRTLEPSDLLIADADRAIALAGIMGGEETEVTEHDDLRAARGGELRAGRPCCGRRSASRSAPRARTAGRRASTPTSPGPPRRWRRGMIVELAGARWTGAADVQANMPTPAVLTLRPERTTARARARRAGRAAVRDPRQARLRADGAAAIACRPGAHAT